VILPVEMDLELFLSHWQIILTRKSFINLVLELFILFNIYTYMLNKV